LPRTRSDAGNVGDVVETLDPAVRAQNGEEALLLARTERPDLVVSDHMMPRRPGYKLLRALRSDPELARCRSAGERGAPEGLDEADAFLSKPVDVTSRGGGAEGARTIGAGAQVQGAAEQSACNDEQRPS